MRTYSPKPGDVDAKWYVIDATDVVLGRLAAQVATLLRGKHKPSFAPNADGGDYVIIVNADKVALTGSKRVEKAVAGMLPKNTLGRQQLKKLKVYRGAEHPHQAQQPEQYSLKKIAQ